MKLQNHFLPSSALYGTQYTAEEINLALNSDNPASIVPTRDENGPWNISRFHCRREPG